MGAALRFVSAADVAPADWDTLIEAAPDGWVFALSGWQRLILSVSEWGLSDVSFAAYCGAELVAAMPLQFQASTKRLASSGWGLAGPALAPSLRGPQRADALKAMLERAEAVARDMCADVLEVGRSPVTLAAFTDAEAADPFSAFGFEDYSTQTRVIRLDRTEDELWRQLSKNARQMVSKAVRLGYTTRRGSWNALLDEYYRVHCETYHRTGATPHPKGYFAGIAAEMDPQGHAVLMVGYAPDGKPTAFHNDARLGPGALYHTGCSETAHLDSGVNYLLMWEAILDARRSGCRWYEVGEVFPDAEGGKSRGLTIFKSKFGGELRRSIKARRALAPNGTSPVTTRPVHDADREIRAAYEAGAVYDTTRICRQFNKDAADYVDRLLQEKFALVAEFYSGGSVVDLCCAAGSHLVDIAEGVDRAIGIDFSARYLVSAQALAATQSRRNVALVQADARGLPLAGGSIDFLYCFSSLYAIPRAEDVIAEVGRVLAPGGKAVLDFGNRRSINVYCLRYYTEWPVPHPLTLAEIRQALARARLETVRHRRFQLLPLWAGKPAWLWPILHPFWKDVLKRRVMGKMLDEWLSSLPVLRAFAFRHLIVCRKVGTGVIR